VVQVIDNRGEQETGTIVVKLDKLTATLRWKMKIPCTEKANLRPPQLCNCWRLFQSCRPPWLTRRNCVKDADEFGDFRESGATDNLCRGPTENSAGTPGIPAA
jgi:hypothetical protein